MSDWNTGVALDPVFLQRALLHKFRRAIPKATQNAGSSAGVALSNMYPEAKSVGRWLRDGWFVAVSYVVGFFVMLAILGWHPDTQHKKRVDLAPTQTSQTIIGGT